MGRNEKENAANVTSPFVTTWRTTRRVGLGISLLKQAREGLRREFYDYIGRRRRNRANSIVCTDNIDRPPIGDLQEMSKRLSSVILISILQSPSKLRKTRGIGYA